MSQRRQVWIAVLVVLGMIVLSLFSAPTTTGLRQGSTYSRAPDGYGAWYASVQAQGIEIQRWQKPLEQLPPGQAKTIPIDNRQGQAETAPITLLQIANGQGWLNAPDRDWIAQGNVFIQLGVGLGGVTGVNMAVTEAAFTSTLSSPVGAVKIQTSRRAETTVADRETQTVLADPYGSVVWSEAIGQGQLIVSITPHLAANAYQDEPGNFALLTQLVTAADYPIWVDEYLHGYADSTDTAEAPSETVVSYLARTPVLLVIVQLVIGLLLCVWGLNQRLGTPIPLRSPPPPNSQAYIQALAAVLRKANSSEFVVKTIGKAEQRHVQQHLGLGLDPVEPTVVIATWKQRHPHSTADLEALLKLATQPRRLSSQELLTWLRQVWTVRQELKDSNK